MWRKGHWQLDPSKSTLCVSFLLLFAPSSTCGRNNSSFFDFLKESFATQCDWRNIIRERSYNYLLGRHALGEMYPPNGRVTHYFLVFWGRKIPLFYFIFAPKAQKKNCHFFSRRRRNFFWYFLGSKNKMDVRKSAENRPIPWTSENRPIRLTYVLLLGVPPPPTRPNPYLHA